MKYRAVMNYALKSSQEHWLNVDLWYDCVYRSRLDFLGLDKERAMPCDNCL